MLTSWFQEFDFFELPYSDHFQFKPVCNSSSCPERNTSLKFCVHFKHVDLWHIHLTWQVPFCVCEACLPFQKCKFLKIWRMTSQLCFEKMSSKFSLEGSDCDDVFRMLKALYLSELILMGKVRESQILFFLPFFFFSFSQLGDASVPHIHVVLYVKNVPLCAVA